MYKFTLQDAKASGALRAIAGTCTSNQQFVDRINESQERLAKRGDFFGMIQHMRLCFRGCNPTWPRSVGTIIQVRACSLQGQISVQNDFSNYPAIGTSGWYNYEGAWGDRYESFGGFASNSVLSDNGTACTYSDITGQGGKLIRYYVVKANDIGKKITLFGKQFGGQPLQEKVDGVWVDGLTLTAARPFVSSTVNVTHIQSITREATEGMAYLYEYDPATDLMRDLAVFEPNETNPRYRRSLLRNNGNLFGRNNVDVNGQPCKHTIEALVKLNFIPVKNDRDFLMVDDFYALKFMIQAIKMEEANDQEEAEKLILKAIRELNFGDRDKNPDGQIPVRTDFTMASTLRNPW
jgi:hypothetical protein